MKRMIQDILKDKSDEIRLELNDHRQKQIRQEASIIIFQKRNYPMNHKTITDFDIRLN